MNDEHARDGSGEAVELPPLPVLPWAWHEEEKLAIEAFGRQCIAIGRASQPEIEWDISTQELLLMAGEMTAQELRTVRAVLGGLKARAKWRASQPVEAADERARLTRALAEIWTTLDHDEWQEDFVAEVNSLLAARAAPTTSASAVPEGWRLLKDTTAAERAWPEDASHENGNYYNECVHCLRLFVGHKRRVVCKVCAAAPSPEAASAADEDADKRTSEQYRRGYFRGYEDGQYAARAAPTTSASAEAIIERCAVAAWNAGMDAHDKALGLLCDAREVGSQCAKSIRALAAAPSPEAASAAVVCRVCGGLAMNVAPICYGCAQTKASE